MWFAPDSRYGRPEELKAFIDAAHRRSLMVFVDVVHGNYLPAVAPIFTKKHKSPWGDAINYDGPGAAVVRELVIESALCCVTEFNLDGLRFDAVTIWPTIAAAISSSCWPLAYGPPDPIGTRI